MNQASPCQIHAASRQRAHEAEALMMAFEVATPSSTEPTVSTLTTEGGGGVKEREKMVYKKRAEKRVSGYLPSRVCLIVLTLKLRL
jgi:hypothetical protein